MTRHRVIRSATFPLIISRLRHAALAFSTIAAALLLSGPAPAQQITIPQPALESAPALPAAAMADDVVSRGQKLESQHRWGEALALYEEASRKDPPTPGIDDRIDLARIHYDLGRRCADSSFRRGLAQIDEPRALQLYDDVLGKIDSHYVQEPNWGRLVARGTLDLEVAVNEPAFVANNHLQATPAEVNEFRRHLHALVDNRPLQGRNEARDLVAAAAHLAQTELGLSPTVAILEYTTGAAGGLDEYSMFLTADQLNDLYSQIEGNFVGLGVELKAADGALLIVNVIHNSPAERGGLKAGDKITAVAGRATHDLSTDAAADLLQGPENTTVELTTVRGTEPPTQSVLRREHVDVPSIDDVKIVDAASGIGYLKLTCFEKTTSRDLDTALWQLHRQGMKSLIMDLRGNPGGLLTAAVDVSNKFIDQGSIVSTHGRSPQEDYNYMARSTGVWRMPLVVLIDGDSASAAEIFAGAVRDHHRAVLVGVKSYGKGSVQGIFPLGTSGAGIRLTTAKFYSPDGHPFVRVGVQPDILVRNVAKPVIGQIPAIAAPGAQPGGQPSDAILNAALQAARRQLAQR